MNSPNITPMKPSASSSESRTFPDVTPTLKDSDAVSIRSKAGSVMDKDKDKGFRPGNLRRRGTGESRSSIMSVHSSIRTASDDDITPRGREGDWGISDDARMGLE